MDFDSKIIKDIDKVLKYTDDITRQDLILVIATHIKHNIEKADYHNRESARCHEVILKQYSTLERLLDIQIPSYDG